MWDRGHRAWSCPWDRGKTRAENSPMDAQRLETWQGREKLLKTNFCSLCLKKKKEEEVGNNGVRKSRRMFQKRRVGYKEKIWKMVTLWSGRNSRNSCPTCRHTFCCLLTVLDAHGWLTYIGLPPAAASPTHCRTRIQSPFSVFHTHRHARKSGGEAKSRPHMLQLLLS